MFLFKSEGKETIQNTNDWHSGETKKAKGREEQKKKKQLI